MLSRAATPALFLAFLLATDLFAAMGELELRVVDQQTGRPLAVRMYVWNAQGRPRKVRSQPTFADHFVFQGRVILRLPPGEYTFRVERGCEYPEQTGHFLIRSAARDNKSLQMERFVCMRDQGWLSADLLVRRPAAQYPLWAASEDLDLLAPVETTGPPAVNKSPPPANTEAIVLAAPVWEGERQQFALFNVDRASVPELPSEDPSSSGRLLQYARGNPDAVCVAADIRASDLPMWLASERLDAVVVMRPADATSRLPEERLQPDASRFPGAGPRTVP